MPRTTLSPGGPAVLSRRGLAFDLAALVLLVMTSHFARLGELPVVGEEGRRARGAIDMIETGDWTVVRNQGVVFPDRPPMTNWLIALTGLARDGVDLLAIRLPSSLAVLCTALVLYTYCRRLGSRLEALAAAAVFVTFGQVLQLGRLGESEAVFTAFLSAALLLWHRGYALGRSAAVTWALGYALAALAALTKGLQAPVYFVGVTTLFLAWRRDWRWLLGRGQWIGAGVFCALVLAWQLPYVLATGPSSALETWIGVVGPRLQPDSLVAHLVGYPLEVLGALLPWSPVLGLVAIRHVRRGLGLGDEWRDGSHLAFLVIALAVTFPTVWWSAGAETRYYMPLYPIVAVLIARVFSYCAEAAGGSPGARLRRRLHGTWAAFLALLLALAAFTPSLDPASPLRFPAPRGWLAAGLLCGTAAVAAALWARSTAGGRPSAAAVLTAAGFFAVLHSGWIVTQQLELRQDLERSVARLRAQVPRPETLVSFDPVHANFLYYWGHFVPELPWPRSVDEVPREVEHFAIDRRHDDTPDLKRASRGMVRWTTPGTLPFAWEEVGRLDAHRVALDPPRVEVIIGRVLRDAEGRPLPAP